MARETDKLNNSQVYKMITAKNCDCFELLSGIDNNSIDLILTDPPYHISNNDYDKKSNMVDWTLLYKEFKRVIKKDGPIVIFSNEPFTSFLVQKFKDDFKYKWIWNKPNLKTGFLNANRMPMRQFEEILVFNSKVYYPQGLIEVNKKAKTSKTNLSSKSTISNGGLTEENYVQKYTNYPSNIINFNVDGCSSRIHPNQKPIELLEYLIQTYTVENDIVLDCFSGSFSCAKACKKINRSFTGCEKDEEFYKTAIETI